jgi:hypothetical protein
MTNPTPTPGPDLKNKSDILLAKANPTQLVNRFGAHAATIAIGDYVRTMMRELIEFGCQYKDDVVRVAKAGVDRIVDFDLPQVPEWIEQHIDAVAREWGYGLIEYYANKICPPAENLPPIPPADAAPVEEPQQEANPPRAGADA